MKKFFGILLIIVGALWTLAFLFTFSAADGATLIASLFLLGIGVLAVILGIRMTKGKKSANVNSQQANPQQKYMPPEPQQSAQDQSPQDKEQLTLKELRELTAQKVAVTPASDGLVSALELGTIFGKMNDEKLPFVFLGSDQNGVDMIAHWKLADADYLGLLGLSKHNLQAKFDVLMKFDEENRVLRCKDKLYKKQSSMGFGGMGMDMSTFSGKATSVQKEIVFGRKKDGSLGRVVDFSLDTTILQNAIKEVAEKNGWHVKRVAGKL